MKVFHTFALFLSTAAMLAAQAGVAPVLAKMDESAASFQSVAAKVKRTDYTAVLKESSVDSGKLRMVRTGAHDRLMLIELTQPNPMSVLVKDSKLERYLPKQNVIEEYDLSAQKDMVNQFLLLGFGASGKDLGKSFNVSLGAPETINGEKTTRLDLLPKSSKARQEVQKVELWISDAHGYPLRQKIYRPGGDYYLIEYSDVQWNPGVKAADLALPNAPRIKPGN